MKRKEPSKTSMIISNRKMAFDLSIFIKKICALRVKTCIAGSMSGWGFLATHLRHHEWWTLLFRGGILSASLDRINAIKCGLLGLVTPAQISSGRWSITHTKNQTTGRSSVCYPRKVYERSSLDKSTREEKPTADYPAQLCKAKMQYLLTCKVSRYCFFGTVL